VPILAPTAAATSANQDASQHPEATTQGVPQRPRRSNLIVAAVVVVVMGGMALIGWELAIGTKDKRRSNDFKSPPSEWSGVGYVPADSNLLLRLQFPEEDCEARRLLAEPRPPFLKPTLAQLETWTGLKVEAFNHAVLGISPDSKRPLAVLVVGTRKPFERTELLKNLKADKIGEHHGMPVYGFQYVAFMGRLWCPEKQTFILALGSDFKKGSFEEFPFPPRENLEGLSREMQAVLTDRLHKDSLAWIAGDCDWKERKGMIELALAMSPVKVPRDELDKWAQIKTFALGLDKDLGLGGALRAGDKETSQWLTKNLESLGQKDKLTVAPPPDDAAGQSGHWVNLQGRFSADDVRKLLSGIGSKK
jgi:hypothetical protein